MLANSPDVNTTVYAQTLDDCLSPNEEARRRGQHQCQMLAGDGVMDYLATLPDPTLVCCVTQACFPSQAFEVLVLRRNTREDRLRRYFLQHGMDDEESLDALQALYVRLYTHGLPQYKPPREFEGYLFTIARNLMLDRFRRKRLMHPVELDLPCHSSPEQEAIKNEEAARLVNALDQLPELDAQVLRAYWQENVRLQDLAQQHGLSIATISRRLQAAQKTLRAALER